jgi:hypothetical protein
MDRSKLNKLLQKEMTRKDFLSVTALSVVSVIGIVGVIAELVSHAEGPYKSASPQSGTLTGGAKIVANTTALDSESVEFEPTTTSSQAMTIGVSMGYDPQLFDASDSGLSQYKIIKADGFYGVRQETPYPGVTNNEGTIKAALAAGLDVLLIIDNYQTGDGVEAFTAFCSEVVSMYAPLGIHHYEVLNEQNGNDNWDSATNTVNPAAYATLLKSVYAAIKAVDSSATVVLGGLAVFMDGDGTNEGGGNYSGSCLPGTFMTDFYAATGGTSEGYFDALGIHPYPGNQLPTTSNNWGVFLNPPGEAGYYGASVRSIMVSNGDSAKQMWITEYGSETDVISDSLEAQIYTNGISLAKAMGYVGAFYCFNWNDDADGDYGLNDTNYNPKPALAAVEAFL